MQSRSQHFSLRAAFFFAGAFLAATFFAGAAFFTAFLTTLFLAVATMMILPAFSVVHRDCDIY